MSERVAEIIAIEEELTRDSGSTSERAWRAAELISAELQTGTTKTALGEAIGKSRFHVLFMSRCWDLVGSISGDPKPNFWTVYNSTEVRGAQTDQGDGSGSQRQGSSGRHTRDEPDPEPDPRETASSWVAAAAEALDLLLEHSITWQFLNEADLVVLRSLPSKADQAMERIIAANDSS